MQQPRGGNAGRARGRRAQYPLSRDASRYLGRARLRDARLLSREPISAGIRARMRASERARDSKTDLSLPISRALALDDRNSLSLPARQAALSSAGIDRSTCVQRTRDTSAIDDLNGVYKQETTASSEMSARCAAINKCARGNKCGYVRARKRNCALAHARCDAKTSANCTSARCANMIATCPQVLARMRSEEEGR